MTDATIAELIELANDFGADPRYVRAGGGNASVKVDGVLWIKPSGVGLATVAADDLVPLRTADLLDALHSDEPVVGDPVRAAAERATIGQPARRPSVEILFHALMPDRFVLHSHPPLVNMVTCAADAAELTARLFGDAALFTPYTDPGVPLARAIERARQEFEARTGQPAPGVTLLGNHGLIVAGDTPAEVRQRSSEVMAAIRAALAAAAPADGGAVDPVGPGWSEADPVPIDPVSIDPADRTVVNAVAPTLRALLAVGQRLPVVTADLRAGVAAASLTQAGRAIMSGGPLIPDQIVYAGVLPVVIEPGDDPAAATVQAVAAYRERHGHDPITAVVPGLGVFAAGADLVAAQTAAAMLSDALRVATGADRLGGVRTMTAAEAGFIADWEAEAYRKQVATRASGGRLDGKIVLVTGGAQGFGLGIAQACADQGAQVVLADLNLAVARREAAALSARHGAGRALAVAVDVADEQSQIDAVAQVVASLGGVDVFVSNAGLARAGSVLTQAVGDFDLVTAINYRGYFLGVRAVAPIMAAQHRARGDLWFDIVEINSKSGLEGSKRNFAYSGSKFGGLGLTQSFALELVEVGVKVNAVCPGNYLDGPLWTDPERGLLVQYLKAGKVPGATSTDDVRAYYEAKVPMGRGCQPIDLARAIFYLVEQQYETGQAVPVTGGQIMLN